MALLAAVSTLDRRSGRTRLQGVQMREETFYQLPRCILLGNQGILFIFDPPGGNGAGFGAKNRLKNRLG